jgi:L-lactate dehydrogenase complex protein LldG
MSFDTRAQILGRVRHALRDVPAGENPEDVFVQRDYHRAGSGTQGSLIDLFAERAADYRARVSRATEQAAPNLIGALLTQDAIGYLAVPPGFPTAFLTALERTSLVSDDPPLSTRSLDHVHGVITTSALAIAQTGTVILDGTPGQGRRALTLIPDYHLCLVHADQIVETVPDAIARLDPRRPLTWISGPSATSDIENNRVEGVHGPRTLHILVIERGHRTDQP